MRESPQEGKRVLNVFSNSLTGSISNATEIDITFNDPRHNRGRRKSRVKASSRNISGIGFREIHLKVRNRDS